MVSKIGDENIRLQNLLECMTNIRTNKRGVSKIEFGTEAITANDVGTGRVQFVPLILWLPKDKVDEIMAGRHRKPQS